MEVVHRSCVTIKKIVDAIRDLTSDVRWTFSKTAGLTSTEMDSSHVALIQIQLPPSAFDKYRVGDSNKTSEKDDPADDDTNNSTPALGISLDTFKKLLAFGSGDETVGFSMKQRDDDCIFVAINQPIIADDSSKTKKRKSKIDRDTLFRYQLKTIDGAQFQVPETVYRFKIEMGSKDLHQVVMMFLQQKATYINFKVSRDKIDILTQESTLSGIISFKANEVFVDGIQKKSRSLIDDASSRERKKKNKTNNDEDKTKDESDDVEPSSNDIEPMKIEMNRLVDEDGGEENDIQDITVAASYSTAYLAKFLKGGSPLSSRCTLYIHPDIPLKLEFEIPNDNDINENGSLRFFLAPRVESESDALTNKEETEQLKEQLDENNKKKKTEEVEVEKKNKNKRQKKNDDQEKNNHPSDSEEEDE